MKKDILTFAVILSFSFSGASQESDYSYTESYQVKKPFMLTVSSNSRNIEVIAHKENSVQVFYTVTKNHNLLELNRNQIENGVDDLWKMKIKNTSNSLTIEVTDNVRWDHSKSKDNIAVDLKILVPEQTSSRLHSSDGDILLKGLALDQTCKANDGNIKLIDLVGKISATASDGDILVENVTGILDSHTPDGQVINLSN